MANDTPTGFLAGTQAAPLNPAAHVLKKAGGARIVAEWRGLTLAAVHKWTYPREKGGTGGSIPTDQQLPLMLDARRAGIDLVPEDFFLLPHGLPPLGFAVPANDNVARRGLAANDTIPVPANDNHAGSLEPTGEA